MSFEVGDMVVCVDDSVPPGRNREVVAMPVIGGIYTIREFDAANDGIGVRLVEIVNPPYPYAEGPFEPAFHPSRFRKIRKPSIEIFREIVANVKGDSNVDA